MVRTNRGSSAAAANIDALDNIDLDDMFADDGDALFDGLDIDLAIDDITGGGTADESATSTAATTGASPLQETPSEPASPVLDAPKSSRRTTKRKTTKYSAYDDDISVEMQPPKRAKISKDMPSISKEVPSTSLSEMGSVNKRTKSKSKKSGGDSKRGSSSKKSIQDDVDDDKPPPSFSKEQTCSNYIMNNKSTSKLKLTARATSVSMPPPVLMTTRGTSVSTTSSNTGVAAAGQFGGRQKRASSTSFAVLPKVPSMKSNKLPLMSRTMSSSAELHSKKPNKQQEIDLQRSSKTKQKMLDSTRQSVSSYSATTILHPPSSASAQSAASIKYPIPPQKEFCGLKSSYNLFYPFMPALPAEPTMKNRKQYGLIDRTHSNFLNFLSNPEKLNASEGKPSLQTEPIFHLLEEAFKDDAGPAVEDAKRKSETIYSAVGELRRTIKKFDKTKLAEDLFAVCSLIQKQHDFLQQNAHNMKRWCKNNLPETEYIALYKSKKSSALYDDDDTIASPRDVTVLESFGRRDLKVKITCEGFKEPHNKAGSLPLMALLPPRFTPPPPPLPPPPRIEKIQQHMNEPTIPSSKSSKKRKLPATTTASASPPSTKQQQPSSISATKPSITYASMKPLKRRKRIADLISRTARELESQYHSRRNEVKVGLDSQDAALRQFIEEDKKSLMQTTGMWRYMERSGYFSILTDSEIRERLDELRSPVLQNEFTTKPLQSLEPAALKNGKTAETFIFDRLQSLLVEEDNGEDSDSDGKDSMDIMDFDIEDSISYDAEFADLSALTIDERAYVHLRGLGIAENRSVPMGVDESAFNTGVQLMMIAKPSAFLCHQKSQSNSKEVMRDEKSANGLNHRTAIPITCTNSVMDCEIDVVIAAMNSDLVAAAENCNRRAAFLESMSESCSYPSIREYKRKDDEDANLIAKCHQLLLKSKSETKDKEDWPMTWNFYNNNK